MQSMKRSIIVAIIIMLLLTAFYFFLKPKKNEFAETDVFDNIIRNNKIKIGVDVGAKPFAFYNDKHQLVGADVDLAKYIAKYITKNENNIIFVPTTPSNRFIKIASDEVDFVVASVTITPQRKEIASFSVPYDYAGQALLVKNGSRITSIADLSGEYVGVIFGTTAERNLKDIAPNAKIQGFKTYIGAYNALKYGQIQAITSDDTILKTFAYDDKSLKLLPKRYSREPYGVAFKKGKSTVKLKENIDYAIKDLQQKNVIKRLHTKWNY